MNVYFIRARDNANLVKIGVSVDPANRLETLQVGHPSKLELLGTIACSDPRSAYSLEKTLHTVFGLWRVRGEWFSSGAPLREFVAATMTGVPVAQALQLAKASDTYKRKRRDANIRRKRACMPGEVKS